MHNGGAVRTLKTIHISSTRISENLAQFAYVVRDAQQRITGHPVPRAGAPHEEAVVVPQDHRLPRGVEGCAGELLAWPILSPNQPSKPRIKTRESREREREREQRAEDARRTTLMKVAKVERPDSGQVGSMSKLHGVVLGTLRCQKSLGKQKSYLYFTFSRVERVTWGWCWLEGRHLKQKLVIVCNLLQHCSSAWPTSTTVRRAPIISNVVTRCAAAIRQTRVVSLILVSVL